ncbi:hypothetical protein HPP92_001974 [Vanilla planifolia]|uniref:Uncharacterized protein n=1 Tax=Vanilla planifolia TaxID=51239 RepID=A0A835SDV1_VANPL|nr:hypothetical protein HPP92_001974 [Vanilla planifolia]
MREAHAVVGLERAAQSARARVQLVSAATGPSAAGSGPLSAAFAQRELPRVQRPKTPPLDPNSTVVPPPVRNTSPSSPAVQRAVGLQTPSRFSNSLAPAFPDRPSTYLTRIPASSSGWDFSLSTLVGYHIRTGSILRSSLPRPTAGAITNPSRPAAVLQFLIRALQATSPSLVLSDLVAAR